MTPLIVKTSDIRQLIDQACMPHSDPFYRQINRSDWIIVPRLEFLKKSWQPHWNTSRILHLGHNNGWFCELFAGFASQEFNRLAFAHCKANNVDAAGGLIEISITIKPEVSSFMGVSDRNHATNLVIYTEDGENPKAAFWEPQNSKFDLVPIEQGLEQVVLKDVAL